MCRGTYVAINKFITKNYTNTIKTYDVIHANMLAECTKIRDNTTTCGTMKQCDANDIVMYLKGMVLYSAVSSPLDRSKRFPLSSPGRPVHSDTVLGFSWKHSSHAAIAQRLFTHISTTVYIQVLIYTAESTEASWSERK